MSDKKSGWFVGAFIATWFVGVVISLGVTGFLLWLLYQLVMWVVAL